MSFFSGICCFLSMMYNTCIKTLSTILRVLTVLRDEISKHSSHQSTGQEDYATITTPDTTEYQELEMSNRWLELTKSHAVPTVNMHCDPVHFADNSIKSWPIWYVLSVFAGSILHSHVEFFSRCIINMWQTRNTLDCD